MFELELAIRYLRPRRTYVSVITLLSLGGVTLGVMVLILVTSVMAGFQQELREKVMGFLAHVEVTNFGVLEDWRTVVESVEKTPDVVAATPFVTGPVLIEVNNRAMTPILRGIDPVREQRVTSLMHKLVAGEFLLEGESVVIGERMASENNLWLGDRLHVLSPWHLAQMRQAYEEGKEVVLLPTELVVTGIFRTGLYEYDARFILVGLEMGQELYGLGDAVHGVAVRVKNPLRADVVSKSLNTIFLPPIRALTWREQNPSLFAAIAQEQVVMFFLLFFIVIVAAMGLMNTLITVTVQKTNEIGLLSALGATRWQIMRIFVAYGFIVGFAGSLLGVITGLVLVNFRNPVASWLGRTTGIEVFPPEIYGFSMIPARLDAVVVAMIAVSALGLCVLAALLPAWKAASIQPARALRYE